MTYPPGDSDLRMAPGRARVRPDTGRPLRPCGRPTGAGVIEALTPVRSGRPGAGPMPRCAEAQPAG